MEYIGDTDRTLQFVVLYKEETAVLSPSGEAGGGGALLVAAQQSFILGGSAPRFNLLPVYIPFLTEKVPLSFVYLLVTNGTPFTHLV